MCTMRNIKESPPSRQKIMPDNLNYARLSGSTKGVKVNYMEIGIPWYNIISTT